MTERASPMSERTERIARALSRTLDRMAREYNTAPMALELGERLAPLVGKAIEAAANVRIDSAMAQDWAWDAALHALEDKP